MFRSDFLKDLFMVVVNILGLSSFWGNNDKILGYGLEEFKMI